ncbi:MAG TPA: hypothetical protein VNH83_18910 [Bryobacteraceae bacterium]|nr:hypothetical protein [Bryobacteraceae bacterium]
MSNQSSVTIEGCDYKLEFDFDLLVRAEEETRLNLLLALTHIDLASAGQFRGIFAALLWKHSPRMTLAEIGALITPVSLPAIAAAFGQLFPEEEKPETPAA